MNRIRFGTWLLVATLLGACSGVSATSDAPAANVLVRMTRSGGLQGTTDALTVHDDGSLTLSDAAGNARASAQASAAQLQQLQVLLASTEWQQLESSYGSQLPDAYMYTINAGDKNVTTFDGATRPPILDDVLTLLMGLLQQVQATP